LIQRVVHAILLPKRIVWQRVRFEESEDIIDICMDNVFKAVFTKDTPASRGALSRLVSAIIGRELSILAIVANDPTIENLRDRQLRFDINCRTGDGELVNVEMSLNPDRFKPVRLEFHTAKLFIGQDIKGTDKTYNDLKRTYQIAILVKEKFFPDGDFFHGFEYFDPVRGVTLGGRTRILTLELSKLEEVARKPPEEMSDQEKWAVFFRYLTDTNMRDKINGIMASEEGIEMASEVLLTISRDEVERTLLASQDKWELDMQSRLGYAKEDGIREGRKEGARELSSELLDLISKGHTLEDIKRELANR